MRSLLMFAVLAGAPALAADGEALIAASDLPLKAKELRDAGVDADQVSAALDAAKASEVPAGEVAALFGEAAPLVKEHGAVENFGEFVKGKLDEGLRGKDLADAIKEAHGGKAAGAASAKPTTPKPAGPKPVRTRPDSAVKPGLTRPVPAKGGGGGGRKGGGGGGAKTRPGGVR